MSAQDIFLKEFNNLCDGIRNIDDLLEKAKSENEIKNLLKVKRTLEDKRKCQCYAMLDLVNRCLMNSI